MNELVLEEGITFIKAHQFENEQEIECVKCPSTLGFIGNKAFKGCKNLKVVELNDGIKEIDHFAFSNTSAVIFVPKSIKRVGDEAFSSKSVVFFEGAENSFDGYYNETYVADYPDDYYRGPSMGVSRLISRFYEDGCKLFYNATKEDFLDYVKNNVK